MTPKRMKKHDPVRSQKREEKKTPFFPSLGFKLHFCFSKTRIRAIPWYLCSLFFLHTQNKVDFFQLLFLVIPTHKTLTVCLKDTEK